MWPHILHLSEGTKECHNLNLKIQGLEIQHDFYVFELRGFDVALCMDWLAGLGEIHAIQGTSFESHNC